MNRALTADLHAVLRHVYAGAAEFTLHANCETGLSENKLKLLHILARPHTRPPDISRVAAMLEVKSGPATRIVQELDKARLVDSTPDEDDARVRRVRITPAGRRIIDDLNLACIRSPALFIRTLRVDERRLLRRFLDPVLGRPEIKALRPEE
jgi:DNA-binding MarR family transcriptional regulator